VDFFKIVNQKGSSLKLSGFDLRGINIQYGWTRSRRGSLHSLQWASLNSAKLWIVTSTAQH
jgi:hypothetical protein